MLYATKIATGLFLSIGGVIAASHSTHSANAGADAAQAEVRNLGRFVVVCREPVRSPRQRLCVTVGALSRLVPTRAIDVADQMSRLARDVATKAPGNFERNEFWRQLLGRPHQVGCLQTPEPSVVFLAVRVPHGNRPSTRTIDCKQETSDPITSSFRSLVTSSGTASLLGVYAQAQEQCQAKPLTSRQGGPQGLMNSMEPRTPREEKSVVREVAEKVWKEIVDAIGEGDPDKDLQGTGGPRGYCFEDMACAMSCEQAARARAIAQDLLNRYKHDGCNKDVRPRPDGTQTCYNVLNSFAVTPEQLAELRHEWCEKQQRFMQTGSEPRCSIASISPARRDFSPCDDPRAMCIEDVDPVDFPLGAGASGVERGPVPPPSI